MVFTSLNEISYRKKNCCDNLKLIKIVLKYELFIAIWQQVLVILSNDMWMTIPEI